jgi:hypothetical protein
MLGYAALAVAVLLSARGRWPMAAWGTAAPLVAAHVLLVWAYRYEWQLSRATRNGYAGFVVFHTALLLIVAAPLMRGKAVALLRLAFVLVTVGALGAVFRYEEVSAYRVPVMLAGLVGGLGLVLAARRKRALPTGPQPRTDGRQDTHGPRKDDAVFG